MARRSGEDPRGREARATQPARCGLQARTRRRCSRRAAEDGGHAGRPRSPSAAAADPDEGRRRPRRGASSANGWAHGAKETWRRCNGASRACRAPTGARPPGDPRGRRGGPTGAEPQRPAGGPGSSPRTRSLEPSSSSARTTAVAGGGIQGGEEGDHPCAAHATTTSEGGSGERAGDDEARRRRTPPRRRRAGWARSASGSPCVQPRASVSSGAAPVARRRSTPRPRRPSRRVASARATRTPGRPGCDRQRVELAPRPAALRVRSGGARCSASSRATRPRRRARHPRGSDQLIRRPAWTRRRTTCRVQRPASVPPTATDQMSDASSPSSSGPIPVPCSPPEHDEATVVVAQRRHHPPARAPRRVGVDVEAGRAAAPNGSATTPESQRLRAARVVARPGATRTAPAPTPASATGGRRPRRVDVGKVVVGEAAEVEVRRRSIATAGRARPPPG